jgi:hypothetical protein
VKHEGDQPDGAEGPEGNWADDDEEQEAPTAKRAKTTRQAKSLLTCLRCQKDAKDPIVCVAVAISISRRFVVCLLDICHVRLMLIFVLGDNRGT